ncbi:hypothetical protein [Paenibacillus dakarensis]|uniref:hypothetical protein n=1 Tax=Paenibacillus dakarensis TaxID=1527293 RepID=UPI0006D5634A|nr:hypothetical protein [Paenibacillus dakarensis]
MANKVKSYLITILGAFTFATLLFFFYTEINESSHGAVKEATTNNIDLAFESSPVVVIGKIISDSGTTRNLRRDSVDPTKEDNTVSVPGTDYDVEVVQVLKGNVEVNSKIKVAVPGGDYKGVSAPLQASLTNNEEYIFTLAPSPSSPSSYFGMIEPFIFQLRDNMVVAITNNEKIKAEFQEVNLTEADIIQKFKE